MRYLFGLIFLFSTKDVIGKPFFIQGHNDSLVRKAKLLKQLCIMSTGSGSAGQPYQVKFFEAFPASFSELVELYGFNNDTAALLYNDYVVHIVDLFDNITVVDDADYYKKLISISINGKWEADATSAIQKIVRKRVVKNPALTVQLLSSLPDESVRSFWYFYFDGPHPSKAIDPVPECIKTMNSRVYRLMVESHSSVLHAWQNH